MAITREFPWQYQGIRFGKTRDFYLTEYMSSFDASSLMDPWGSFSMWPTPTRSRTRRHSVEQEYLEELKNVAACCGYSPASVDRLLESGFSTDEIEEFLYEGTMYQ